MSTPTPAARPAFSWLRGYNPLARRVEQREGFPVVPGAFPVLGHMPANALDMLGLLRDAERALGPMFYLNQGFENWQLVYTRPDAFSLFKNKLTTSDYMSEGAPGILFGKGVIVQDGAPHRHLRAAMNGPFQPRGLEAAQVGTIIAELVERRVSAWVGRRDVRVLGETRELALDVMFRLVGVDEAETGAWRHQYEELLLLIINLPSELPGLPRSRGLRARRWIDERLGAMIARARSGGGENGLLPALLQSRDEAGEALSDGELIDNLRLIFLAGHETSATTMAWMVAHLADRPDVWRKLRTEALAAPDLPRSPKDLRLFPYAEAVFRETLRLHPPVAADARRALVDFELDGRTVRKGTMVTIPILTMSRDPGQYPEPDAFRPERWLDRREALSPLELVQFGGGPHFCLGYHLAWMEIVAFATALGRALPVGGPRLQNGFPAPRYLPLHHPAASMKARFD